MTPTINWNPTNKDLRKFGWTILIGFGIIGALFFLKGRREAAGSIWAIFAAIAFLALVLPPVSRPFYWIWMGVAFVMGSIMSRVILTVIFFAVITPVAIIFKMMGRDPLRRKKTDGGTYWTDHPTDLSKESYKHLF